MGLWATPSSHAEQSPVAEELPVAQLACGRLLGEGHGPRPLPCTSSEATIGNESDSCRLMMRPRATGSQDAVTTVQQQHMLCVYYMTVVGAGGRGSGFPHLVEIQHMSTS